MWSDPYLLVFARAPPSSTPADLRALEPHLSMKRDARDHTENGFRQIRKICDYTVVSKVTKILLVKDHARKGKESFHVKIKDSTCATFAVGQFN